MRPCARQSATATELEYSSVFELLAAVLLSAQSTDAGVNKALRRCSCGADAGEVAGARPAGSKTSTIGLFRTKARNLLATCRILVEQHGGVPRTREALEALPGVGRKTANVVLNVAFGEPTMAVDTQSSGSATAPGWPRAHPLEVETAARRVPETFRRRAPLADPAWPLRVPGQAAAVRGVRGRPLVRLGAAGADAGAATPSTGGA